MAEDENAARLEQPSGAKVKRNPTPDYTGAEALVNDPFEINARANPVVTMAREWHDRAIWRLWRQTWAS